MSCVRRYIEKRMGKEGVTGEKGSDSFEFMVRGICLIAYGGGNEGGSRAYSELFYPFARIFTPFPQFSFTLSLKKGVC